MSQTNVKMNMTELNNNESNVYKRTVYPFSKRSSAKYEPSCPVMPVMRAIFSSDMFDEIVVCDLEDEEFMFFCDQIVKRMMTLC